MKNLISDVKKIQFKNNVNSSGSLSVFQARELVPFDIKRVFVVSAIEREERGHHAHIRCSQLLVAVCGEIQVRVFDGMQQSMTFNLNKMNEGLLIPPGIWASQRYIQEKSVLMVLCDNEYNESDYIRDFKKYLEIYK